jgi:phosphotransferase system, enzyme I, PtsP
MSGPLSAVGIRRLLKRLRDLMAVGGSVQERLDQLVRIIAGELVAEVCSVYVMRPGDMLELYATEGLKRDAVHRTRLRVGEGLVGDIAMNARPLALANAQSHPNFAYRPETGEEIYHSLLGVPVLRGGRVRAVLVVQNRTHRDYAEEEVEALETIAMVLAELVASPEGAAGEVAPATQPMRLTGSRFTPGIAIGNAVLHEPRVSIRQMVSDNPDAELERLRDGVAAMREALESLFAASGFDTGSETGAVLETYKMFAEDRGWVGRIAEAVRSGLSAEAAVQKVQQDTRVRMGQVTDVYLRERMADFDDLAHRLLRHLAGGRVGAMQDLPESAVVFARNMGPAELLEYDRARIKAVVLEEGSHTAHVAIIARALGVPMMGRVAGALGAVDTGDEIVVDADASQILIRPTDEVRDSYIAAIRAEADRMAAYGALRDEPSVTRDGHRISLLTNAGLHIDLAKIVEVGAEGVGLFRTEIMFMVRQTYPGTTTQERLYRRVLDRAGGRPVVFRTLDIGGDKVLPYLERPEEENPAMGWRAIRMMLDRPLMLRQQLRALIRAAGGRELSIMFPMISEVRELETCRTLLDGEIAKERAAGREPPASVRVGAMLEVPALIWQLHNLLPLVDFLSVGSNDLLQFLFASDRGNPRLAERYDPLSPPALACLRDIAAACLRAGVPVTLCGDMAAQPIEALALIGLGYRRLSMPASAIPPVKAMLREVDVGKLTSYVGQLCDLTDHSVRSHLRAFARDHAIPV